ncbi:MAG: S49 family peptidase [Dehalococcoidales bacterium]
MSRLEATKRLMRRWLRSIPFFIVLGLALGVGISVLVIPRPNIATITISGPILSQTYTDNILNMLQYARDSNNVKGVVLRIDSPGGGASATEQIYLDVLRLRQQKPVVVSIGTMAASGGYYIAVASNFIYAEPTSQIGSIGAFVSLPQPEELDEDVGTTGPFKATGRSKRKAISHLEMVRQEFVDVVRSQRGDRLQLSEEELSQGEIHVGVEALRFGLIDEIGTKTAAIEKAASLASLRNYEVVEFQLSTQPRTWSFGPSDLADLKSQTGLIPKYYYLHFESR